MHRNCGPYGVLLNGDDGRTTVIDLTDHVIYDRELKSSAVGDDKDFISACVGSRCLGCCGTREAFLLQAVS